MGRLVVNFGFLRVVAIELAQGKTRLGRDPANEVVLGMPEVAAFHAEIERSGELTILRSLDSERLIVNGQPVEETHLSHGDLILLGGYRLRWVPESDAVWDSKVGEGITTAPMDDEEEVRREIQQALRKPLRLVVVGGEDRGLETALDRPAVLVGRSPDCDLVLSDPAVSWRHVCFELVPEGIRIRDLGSRNGTLLDGRRVESVVAEPGATVFLGRTQVRVDQGPTENGRTGLAEMVGVSTPMEEVYQRVQAAAASRVPVLITGETGVGKELVARAIHALGPRSLGAFVPLNCTAIPREVMEDELFGHVKGAFTGASSDRRGAFELADQGTIFLDEISEIAQELQAKLLRVVEDGEIPRLGGRPVRADFRVLSASNRNVTEFLEDGRLRSDLYYRLAVEEIRVPALRDRRSDIPLLVQAFLRQAVEEWGVACGGALQITKDAVDALVTHPWPGNVRELRNLILRASARAPGGEIGRSLVEDLVAEALPGSEKGQEPGRSPLEEAERAAIARALIDCGGSREEAARRLGISRSTLYDKIRRFDLKSIGR